MKTKKRIAAIRKPKTDIWKGLFRYVGKEHADQLLRILEAQFAATAADMTHVIAALTSTSGNISAAAEKLGLIRRTLDRRINEYGLRPWLRKTYPPFKRPKRPRPVTA